MDRVVEVARVLAVDGDQSEAAEVLATLDVDAAHSGGQCRRLRDGVIGPRDRQLVHPHGNVDLHPGQHPGPQHLLDDADRRMAPRRRFGDTRDDIVAIARPGARIRWHENIVMNPGVVRTHESDTAFAPQTPHHSTDSTLDDLHQRAFAACVAIHPHHSGHHAISVHQRAHLTGREEQIGAAVVGPDESESVTMSDDAPGHEVHAFHQPELPAAIADDLTVAFHCAQAPLQCLLRSGSAQIVRGGDSGERDRRARVREKLDQGAALRKVRDVFTGAAGGIAAQVWRAR